MTYDKKLLGYSKPSRKPVVGKKLALQYFAAPFKFPALPIPNGLSGHLHDFLHILTCCGTEESFGAWVTYCQFKICTVGHW